MRECRNWTGIDFEGNGLGGARGRTATLSEARLSIASAIAEFAIRRQKYGSLHNRLKLPDIPGPLVPHETRNSFGTELDRFLSVEITKHTREIPCEERHILAPQAERGHLDRQDVKAVV